ncbi:MAG: hypothetical protein ACSLE3_15040, partial [Microbacteriaceae bacterium]
MQLVLGVAVADSVAHLALLDTTRSDSALDQFDVAMVGGATTDLVRTIADTSRSLGADGYRLSAINIVWSDAALAENLRAALAQAGVESVSVVPTSEAATAYVRSTAGNAGQQTSALILVDGDTAALSVVGSDANSTSLIDAETIAPEGPDTACTAMIDRLRDETGGAQTLYLVSDAADAAALTERLRAQSPIPLHVPAEPSYLLAYGAAAASAPSSVDPSAYTMAAPSCTASNLVIGEHLAYSMAEDSGSIPLGIPEEYDETPLQTPMSPLSNVSASAPHTDDPDEFEEPTAATGGRPRVLLLGSTIAASVVVGFAVLAVGVAINIKPAVSQQAVRDYEAVPGKSMPPMPGQSYEAAEDATVYLPPVVPVSVEEQIAGGPTWYPTRQSGGSAGYAQSSASTGGGGTPAVASGGSGPIGTPVAGGSGGNPLGGFRLADWLPDLPENLWIDFPDFQSPGVCDRECVIDLIEKETSCFSGRAGWEKCVENSSAVSHEAPPTGTIDELDVTEDSPDDPAIDQKLGTSEGSGESEAGSEVSSDQGSEGTDTEVTDTGGTDAGDQEQKPADESSPKAPSESDPKESDPQDSEKSTPEDSPAKDPGSTPLSPDTEQKPDTELAPPSDPAAPEPPAERGPTSAEPAPEPKA